MSAFLVSPMPAVFVPIVTNSSASPKSEPDKSDRVEYPPPQAYSKTRSLKSVSCQRNVLRMSSACSPSSARSPVAEAAAYATIPAPVRREGDQIDMLPKAVMNGS